MKSIKIRTQRPSKKIGAKNAENFEGGNTAESFLHPGENIIPYWLCRSTPFLVYYIFIYLKNGVVSSGYSCSQINEAGEFLFSFPAR